MIPSNFELTCDPKLKTLNLSHFMQSVHNFGAGVLMRSIVPNLSRFHFYNFSVVTFD